MKNIHLIKRSFIRQFSEADCGLACLAMILNYTGQPEARSVLQRIHVPPGGHSLLELRDLARQLELPARCVELDMSFLRNLKSPVILHLQTEHGGTHYQVCYGSRNTWHGRVYVLADPARQVHELGESLLQKQWSSHAALYFADLPDRLRDLPPLRWVQLLGVKMYPAGLMIAVPLLAVCTGLFGVALSWVLQRGLNNPAILQGKAIGALLILLLLMSVFRSGVSVLRQFIITKINLGVNSQLVQRFVDRLFVPDRTSAGQADGVTVRYSLQDIQKIQHAMTMFVAVLLSDGMMAVLLLGGIYYWLPWAGVVNTLYLLLTTLLYVRQLTVAVYSSAQLSYLYGRAEDALTRDVLRMEALRQAGLSENRRRFHRTLHRLTLRYQKLAAVRSGKLILLTEFLGAVNVVIVLALAIRYLVEQQFDYSTFMLTVIFTYLITALLPRIGQALQTMAEGADAAVQSGLPASCTP